MKRIMILMIGGIFSLLAPPTIANECPVPRGDVSSIIMSAGATGTGTATLTATLKPRAAGTAVSLISFEVTGSVISGGFVGPLTISGLVGGPISYNIPVAVNGLGANAVLIINFPCPLTGVTKTNIVATLPVSAGAIMSLVIHGF
jgi:hypothetical protein